MAIQIQNDPSYQLPFLYINGLITSVLTNTTLSVTAGQCRDINDVIDIVIGSPPLNGPASLFPLILDTSHPGVNGLDTGVLIASTLYSVYAIGDSKYYQVPAVILSLATQVAPIMPFGYDSYRLIGYAATDASIHFYPSYISGTGSERMLTYDAPPVVLTNGNATDYSSGILDLATVVPPINNTPTTIYSSLTANAAGNELTMKGFLSTGDAISILAPVAGSVSHFHSYDTILAQLDGTAPTMNYKLSSASASVNLMVASFNFSV